MSRHSSSGLAATRTAIRGCSIDPEIEDGKRLCDEALELVKIFQSIKTKTRTYLRAKGELPG